MSGLLVVDFCTILGSRRVACAFGLPFRPKNPLKEGEDILSLTTLSVFVVVIKEGAWRMMATAAQSCGA
jgi:hypothetical protein